MQVYLDIYNGLVLFLVQCFSFKLANDIKGKKETTELHVKQTRVITRAFDLCVWRGYASVVVSLPELDFLYIQRVWVTALCLHTLKHIRGGWSHYTDTSDSVDRNGAQNIFTVQSGSIEPATFQSLAQYALTGPIPELASL
jgi:hypothetical protein